MIQELQTEFIGSGSVKGFKFTQLERSANAYLYKVEVENSKHYEVFKKKLTKVCVDFNKRIYSETDKKVSYPKDNDFGKWAWCCDKLEVAKNKFDEICN